MSQLSGVMLPVITPFEDGQVDVESYIALIEHYIGTGISGIIPLGTTGESPVISEQEMFEIIDLTVDIADRRVPVYAGIGGNCTGDVLSLLSEVEQRGIDGILSVCPYYNRPGQDGLYSHFKTISEATGLNVIMYNIPYRTGVNMTNETILKLSELPNITGIKDSCGDLFQMLDLLAHKPEGFSVFTGEDQLFFINCIYGGDGGILASSHLYTEQFVRVYELLKANDHQAALKVWGALEQFIPLLFREANPGPVKYCLEILGMINSAEMRLPMTGITDALKEELKQVITDLHTKWHRMDAQ